MRKLLKVCNHRLRGIVQGWKYRLKNLLLLTPISYGYYRYLQKLSDKTYVYDRDKHPVRNKHHGQGGWRSVVEGHFRYRDYSSYDEYRIHQIQKFDEMLKCGKGWTNREILEYRTTFYRRFRYLPALLPESATILCAGARQGTEVEVLQDLGFHNAFGIDLNPGSENKYVQPGDFMALKYADASIDMIYSNCLDHAYDIEQFFREHSRVLKLHGLALYDIAIQSKIGGGAFEAIEWDSEEAVLLMMVKYFGKVVKVETEKCWKWVLLEKSAEQAHEHRP
jgi:SAM-dependent methyltransferase